MNKKVICKDILELVRQVVALPAKSYDNTDRDNLILARNALRAVVTRRQHENSAVAD